MKFRDWKNMQERRLFLDGFCEGAILVAGSAKWWGSFPCQVVVSYDFAGSPWVLHDYGRHSANILCMGCAWYILILSIDNWRQVIPWNLALLGIPEPHDKVLASGFSISSMHNGWTQLSRMKSEMVQWPKNLPKPHLWIWILMGFLQFEYR